MYQRGGSHARGGAHLGLTAPLRPGDGGPGGDDLSEPGGHVEGLGHQLVREFVPRLEGQEHGGQHAAGPRRGGGHDALHAGVALAGFEGGGDDLPQEGPAEAGGPAGYLSALAPHQRAGGAEGRIVLLHALLHGGPELRHMSPGLLSCHAPVPAVVVPDGLPQGDLPGGAQQPLNGCKRHISCPPAY